MGRPKGSKNKKTLEKLDKKESKTAKEPKAKKGAIEYEAATPEGNTDAIASFKVELPDEMKTVGHVHSSARLQDWNRYVEMNVAVAATGSICRLPGSEMWPAETIALRATAIAKAVSAALAGE